MLDNNNFAYYEKKCLPGYFEEIWQGNKTFEFRLDDSGYKTGMKILLREHSKHSNYYTGREIGIEITYLMAVQAVIGYPRFWAVEQQKDKNFVIFSFKIDFKIKREK